MNFPSLSGCAAVALLISNSAAPAATLQFTLTNLSPADSFSIDPILFTNGQQDVTDVIFTPASEGIDVLPQLGFLMMLDAGAGVFPPAGAGRGLPLLLPGDRLTFTLSGVDLLGESTLYYGAGIFGQAILTDPAGSFTGVDLSPTAGAIAAFDSSSGGAPLLIFPDSISPGPSSVTTVTPVLRFTVVPEPASGLLITLGLALALRRRAR